MADVSRCFLLCKGFQKDSLLGIEKHCNKNHVILTFKDRGVVVYDLENNKLVLSLPVQQRREFTSAVVQDPESRKYVGIIENVNICQWHENAEDLVDCQQIKVDKPVFKILVSSTCSLGPVVVFHDGTWSLLSNCNTITTRKTRRQSTAVTQRVLTCKLLKYNNIPLVCMAKHKENRLIVSVSRLVADKDAQCTTEWTIDAPAKNEELLSCCFQEFGNFNFVSLWSEGSLCITELKDVLERFMHQEQNRLTCRCINKINKGPKICNKTRHQKSVVMETLDSTHVCLCYGSNTENNLQDAIYIYETKFGTKQASITLEKLNTDGGTTEGPLDVEHMLCTEGYVCMAVDNCVAACSCTVKESSLATALGKMAPRTRTNGTDGLTSIRPLLCIPQLPDPSKDLKDWMELMQTEQSTEETVLQKLTSPKKIKSPKEFHTELRKYLDSKYSMDNVVDTVKKAPLKSKDKLKGKYRLSQHFVLTVLSQCLEETTSWPNEALSCLIQTRCIPGSASADLLKRLTEKNEIDMILKCLNNIQGIPESSLVSCLQYVLESNDSVFGDEQDDSSAGNTEEDSVGDGCPFGEKRSNLLCHLLSYPVNDVFIQDSIKKMNSSQVMALLKFLVCVIKSAPRSSFARKGSSLDYPTALDWTGWIINAHYTALVLNSNLQGLLLDLHSCVQDQVTLLEMLGELEGFLEQYKNKHPLPAKENVGLYSVEMLEL
ncbi:nucleolar protein 11-like isoform X2 [Actinia tenebrosa]|uniref:Nucleolar protein 11-like isoform X2 n=1 Tax=Actinia tenebrosa TaxID=6105 RepID=A0A6P8JC46_ACTTE|nr:nucleolar protein 11-like isoform X2 [Actinia tenebrosa]